MPISIARVIGKEARRQVDTFYSADGRQTRARDDDLFFLAQLGGKLVGSVRYCVEFGTPLLRGMLIHPDHRAQGIGRQMLTAFAEYLDSQNIRGVFCVPYDYLEEFYGQIGFRQVERGGMPTFLQERMDEYNRKPQRVIVMRRD